MTLVYAGYNRVNTTNIPGNALVTAGVENCIAVAGFDERTGQRTLAHYHTVKCFVSAGQVDVAELTNFKIWLDTNFRARTFQVGLGAMWRDSVGGVSPGAFVQTLNGIFGANDGLSVSSKRQVSSRYTYDQDGVFPEPANADPPGWVAHSDDGVLIPYNNYPVGGGGGDQCIIS